MRKQAKPKYKVEYQSAVNRNIGNLVFFGPEEGVREWQNELIEQNKLQEICTFYGYAKMYEYLLNQRDKNELHSHV